MITRIFRATQPEIILQNIFGATTKMAIAQIDSWKHAQKQQESREQQQKLRNRHEDNSPRVISGN